MIYFNSHAHVERDLTSQIATWSASSISTHTLTWSVTSVLLLPTSRKQFQLTRSRGAWRFGQQSNGLASIFQLTRSRGAWLLWLSPASPVLHFNSHAHVERDRTDRVHYPQKQYFNSHAHVERDSRLSSDPYAWEISTHTLTWSVTNAGEIISAGTEISTHTLTWSVTTLTIIPIK